MLIDIYRELTNQISEFIGTPRGTKVQIGETESRESSISIVLDTNKEKTKWEICGKIRYVYDLKLIYQIEAQTNSKKYKIYTYFEDLIKYLQGHKKETYSSIEVENIPILKQKNVNGLDIFELNCLLYP